MHAIYVRPYLYLVCLEGGANEGSSVITAAAFQVICFVIGILADETLSDEEIDAGMAGKLFSEFLFYIFQVGFVVGADTHEVECTKQYIGNFQLAQVEVH